MKPLTLFVSLCMLMFAIGCGDDESGLTNSDKQALAAAGVVLSDVNGLFMATSDNDGTMDPGAAESRSMVLRKNFYPGMDNGAATISIDNVSGQANPFLNTGVLPQAVAGHTYVFTDDQGSNCELTIGAVDGNGLCSVIYKISPNWTISVDYSYEQILVDADTSWDPVNADGAVDFTARSPYYTRYFDGRIDNMTVIDIQNGKTIDSDVKLTIAPPASIDYTNTGDINDFYSKVDFTVADDKNADGVAEGIQYGYGQRFYSENKSGNTVLESVTKEYNTLEYGKQWDILNLFKSATRECYVTYADYDAPLSGADSEAVTASIVESTDSLLWNLINIDSQTVGKFTKSIDGTDITVDAYYATVNTVWKIKQYSYKTIAMTGDAKTMTGTIKVYRSFINKPASLVDLPLSDASRATLDMAQVNTYKLADPAAVFGTSSVDYVVTHGTDQGNGEYTVSASNLKLTDDSESFTTSVKYNKVTRKVSLNLNTNYLSISEASYENGAVIGKVMIKGNEYEIRISTANGKSAVKLNGKWVAL